MATKRRTTKKTAVPGAELPIVPNARTVRRMGRPQKLTPEIQEEIVRAIKVGSYLEVAASFAGIHRETLNDWLKQGDEQRRRKRLGKYREFSDAVRKAQAEAELSAVAKVRSGGAAWNAWWLERTKHERFGRRERLEHTGADGGPIRAELEGGGLLKLFERMAGEAEEAPAAEEGETTARSEEPAPSGVKSEVES